MSAALRKHTLFTLFICSDIPATASDVTVPSKDSLNTGDSGLPRWRDCLEEDVLAGPPELTQATQN